MLMLLYRSVLVYFSSPLSVVVVSFIVVLFSLPSFHPAFLSFCLPTFLLSLFPSFLSLLSTFRGNFRRALYPSMRNPCKGILDSEITEPKSWLDVAMIRYGGPFHDAIVDDVKVLLCTLLFFFSLVPYWMTYFQMETSFVTQVRNFGALWSKIEKKLRQNSHLITTEGVS